MECVVSIVDEGTELRAVVATIGGHVLGTVSVGGPANVRFIGTAGLRHKLEALLTAAFASTVEPVCLAATQSLHADPEWARETLGKLVPVDAERIFHLPIERSALVGSLRTPTPTRAIVVRSDLASRGFGVADAGREAGRGGYGEILGDEGSAYWIGRRGVAAAIRVFEKRHRNTALRGRLLSHFGIASAEALMVPEHEATPLDRYQIASFAPQVFDAAEQDDEVAIEILDEAGRDLASIALSLINELDLANEPFSALPCGSVFRCRGVCLETFMKTLKNRTSKVSFLKDGMGPAAGGVLLAIHEMGLKVRSETIEVLAATLKAKE